MLIAISILLGLSLSGNVLFFFYTRYLLDKVKFFASNINDLREITQKYATHINTILEKHVYGEDPVLKRLLQHTSEFGDDLKTFIEELDEIKIENDNDESEDSDDGASKEKKGQTGKIRNI